MRFERLILVAVVAVGVAGCSKAQARTPAPAPALDPPASPSKLVIPVGIPEPPPEEPATPPPVETPPPPVSPPITAGRGAPPPTTEPPPDPDPQVLRTRQNTRELENLTRLRLGSANRDLGQVTRHTLDAEARASYDDVTRFIRSAEAALRAKNYSLAQQLADKAALLANLLVKGGVPTAA
jgi:hypothetical protein